DAVIGQQIAEQLPQIVGEAAKAFGNIGQLTVLNGAEGIGQMFSQVLGMGAAAIPMLRGLLDSTGQNGRTVAAGESAPATKRAKAGQPSWWRRLLFLWRVKSSRAADRAEAPEQRLDDAYDRQLELLHQVRHGLAAIVTARKQ